MKTFRPGPKSRNAKSPKDAPRRDNYRKDAAKPERTRSERPARDDARPDMRGDTSGKKPFKPFNRDAREANAARLAGPVLYGTHAVRAAILNPERRIIRLLATNDAAQDMQKAVDEATAKDIKRPSIEIIVDKLAFDRMMPAGAVHQGIAALVESLQVRDAADLVAELDRNEKAVYLILDQVTDPHNVGAIMRSAAAFGAKAVIMQDRHAPELTGVLAKVASGAADVVPVAMETNLSRCIEHLQENGFFVIGLDERGTDIGDLPNYDRLALVLGAEGDGIRRLVAEHCDTLVSLPTQGQILSLNVSNAAAVALYAVQVKN